MSQIIFLESNEYIAVQVALALGSENRYFTAQEVQHDPSPDECLKHWVEDGGADWFHNQYGVNDDKPLQQQS